MVAQTLIITDAETDEFAGISNVATLTFERYLKEYPKLNEPKTRVINLCDINLYLSRGYYCSLLGEARQHRVLPSVKTINQLRGAEQPRHLQRLMDVREGDLDGLPETAELVVCFGAVEDPTFRRLAARVFRRHPAPLLRVGLQKQEGGWFISLQRMTLAELDDSQKAFFVQELARFTQQVWRTPASKKRYRWDMAILVNPDEPTPPSNTGAIKRFIKAARKFGIYAEAVSATDILQVSNYDALFIRETTSINHVTYDLARRAEDAGLVVIDDPDSILRCCNKVYLHDAFSYQHIPSPKTRIAVDSSKDTLASLEAELGYPMVLKIPESSFSKGVFKVADRAELTAKLGELFEETALALVQEFLYTEFDWRIGVLNGRAIYACRYHMARNHWQIYNHGAKRFSSGGFETLPTFEVPKRVLDAAVKSARIIGNGLYGVDIKQKGQNVYVIEVNDNPSIEHKIEDAYLGDELYMLIMAEFQRRLELRGR